MRKSGFVGFASGAAATCCLLLSGCAQVPAGPMVGAMPGPGKTFAAFQADQTACETYAGGQVKGEAEAVNQRAVGAALLTAALGTATGAAIGSLDYNAGGGAAVGAAAATALGAGLAASQSGGPAQSMIQQRYDISYAQCMYARGEQVPGMPPPRAAGAAEPAAEHPAYDHAMVRSVQVELVRLNYLPGKPDGEMGPETRKAIRGFQRDHGMSANGRPSSGLLASLQSTPTSAPHAVAASAPPSGGWVAPNAAGKAPVVTPAASPAPAASSGWVAPTKSQ